MKLRRVGIVGVGLTPFDKHEGVPVEALVAQATMAALADGGVGLADVGAVYASHLYQGEVFGERMMSGLRVKQIEIANFENACAGGSTAMRQAALAVAAEQHDLILVVGAEKMDRGLINFVSADRELAMGNIAPAQYALAGQRHMHEFGTSAADFAAVAVKSRRHGALNPNARLREEVTLEQVLASRPIAEPITLLQCCRNGSGAAAVLVGSESWCQRRGGPRVWIEGSGLRSSTGDADTRDLTNFGATRAAAAAAYEAAGIGPKDLDVVELHDAFTVGELLHYEGLGLCAKGEGGKLARSGAVGLGG
ncbi:MAG: thiolase family protein, partial [Alphaproteobacteria bacterium]|nr:thiolase family protein [Alphaproteobacteria bacterium]